jgi:hypothetical protein
MAEHMLTTVDNPYNPFTQFDEWRVFDESHGYYSLSLLGRIVVTSDELSETQQSQAVEDAIDEIVSENVSGMHTKIEEPSLVKS